MVIKKNKQQGFSLVELMVIVGILGVLLGLAGAFSIKAAYRRAVDSATTRVANTLQLTKMQAARNGVEFRTRFVQSGNELQLITERGDSNVDSTVWTSNLNSQVSFKLESSVVISTMPSFYEFKPNGAAAPDSSFTDIGFVVLAASGTDIDRCGQVIVSVLGRIAVIQGHWDGSVCSQVGDD